jgi:hypothetical protein
MAFTTANLTAALTAAVAGTTHMQLHTGAPGAAGTSNVAAGVSRITFDFPVPGSASVQQVGTFTIPAAGGPYTHISLWTASSGGTFQGDAALTPQETFAGAGTLQVTVTATAT